MPWNTPTLREVRSLVRDNIRGNLPGADALIPNSVLRVLSDNQGALCHLTLQYLDWLALQIMPDTAEAEWLDRYAKIWLVNADGSTGRKMATLAEGEATMSGTLPWMSIPVGTRLTFGDLTYEVTRAAMISASGNPVTVRIRSLNPGVIGNLPAGTSLSVTPPPTGWRPSSQGINATASVVWLYGGVDEESDDDLRYRLLLRIREPPQGGAKHDYEQWALAVPGVTRAWVSPGEMGPGTVTVRVMMDQLRADRDGFPTQDDLIAVRAYIDKMRPVTAKDVFVEAPIPQRVDVHIANLVPDTPSVRAGIEDSLRDMFMEKAAPGQTIFGVWKTHAVMDAPGVESFDLVNCGTDDFMLSAGHLPVLGSIIYSARGTTTAPSGAAIAPEPEEPGEDDGEPLIYAEIRPEPVMAAIPDMVDIDLTPWRPRDQRR